MFLYTQQIKTVIKYVVWLVSMSYPRMILDNWTCSVYVLWLVYASYEMAWRDVILLIIMLMCKNITEFGMHGFAQTIALGLPQLSIV